MAAPTNAAFVKKVLANSEPSTHGPKRTFHDCALMSAFGGKADIRSKISADDAKLTFEPTGLNKLEAWKKGLDCRRKQSVSVRKAK